MWRKHSSNQTSPVGLALTERAQRNHTAKDQHDSGRRDFRDKTPWLILHRMSSTTQALLLDKFTKLQTFQSSSNLSLTPNFCSNDLTRTTRRNGESQAFGQDHPATDLSPLLCPSKFCLSILYRSINLLKTILPISF
jgi:hypothetical protein